MWGRSRKWELDGWFVAFFGLRGRVCVASPQRLLHDLRSHKVAFFPECLMAWLEFREFVAAPSQARGFDTSREQSDHKSLFAMHSLLFLYILASRFNIFLFNPSPSAWLYHVRVGKSPTYLWKRWICCILYKNEEKQQPRFVVPSVQCV